MSRNAIQDEAVCVTKSVVNFISKIGYLCNQLWYSSLSLRDGPVRLNKSNDKGSHLILMYVLLHRQRLYTNSGSNSKQDLASALSKAVFVTLQQRLGESPGVQHKVYCNNNEKEYGFSFLPWCHPSFHRPEA